MKTKIKLMFIASSLSGGGAERMLINIINSLSPEKYDILLAITSQEKSNQINKNVTTENYNKSHTYKAFIRLLKKSRIYSPDYIFTTDSSIGYMLPIIRKLLRYDFKIFLRVAVPPSEYPINDFKTKILRFISKATYNQLDLIIAQTEFSKQDIKNYYSIDEKKIRVIRNIIDPSFLNQSAEMHSPSELIDSNYNIIASGALYSIKGFDILIKSVARIKDLIPNLKLYILGEERYESGYKAYLQNLIITNSLEETVYLLGHKQNPFPYYKFASLFVMSSRKEGFPNVVLENLFYKTPVVATDCVDFSGVIIPGINGYIARKDSEYSLSHAITLAYQNLHKPCVVNFENYNYEELFK